MNDNFDLGVFEKKLSEHRYRKRWLAFAEELLRSSKEVIELSNVSDYIRSDSPQISFSVPRHIWEPQLHEQCAKVRGQIEELDRLVRQYLETALR